MSAGNAVHLEQNGYLEDAIHSYEVSLQEVEGGSEAAANYVMLLWELTFEFNSFDVHISDQLVQIARDRLERVREVSLELFSDSPEVLFWVNFTRNIDFGGIDIKLISKNLRNRYSQCLDPEIALFEERDVVNKHHPAYELYGNNRSLGTARSRYICSYLEGVIKRGEFGSY